MSNPVGHNPQTLVFRPTHTGQVLIQSVIIPNVPSDADLTATLEARSSVGPFEVLRVVSYDRASPGGPIDPTPDDESDGVTPLGIRKGELVQIFVQLMVPDQISEDLVDRLSVAGKDAAGFHRKWGFSVPVIALLTNVSITFPTEPFTIFPGETKSVPVEAAPGLVPPASVTLQYALSADPKFSAQPLTLVFQSGQPETGILSVTCGGDTALGPHYLRFDVTDPASDPFLSVIVVA